MVNGAKLARKITDATVLQPLNSGKLTPWQFTRADVLQVENNKVTSVDLQPWEVAIWEVR